MDDNFRKGFLIVLGAGYTVINISLCDNSICNLQKEAVEQTFAAKANQDRASNDPLYLQHYSVSGSASAYSGSVVFSTPIVK